MTVPLIVCGAAGRMGRALVAVAAREADFRIVGAVEASASPAVGTDAGEVAGVGALGIGITDDYGAAVREDAVTLEFTTPTATLEHLRVAVARQAPIVIGTTGFSAAEQRELDSLAPRTRCLVAPNMSVGVNVLLALVRAAAHALGTGFDAEIVELHHRAKIDAPSGTALALGRAVAASLGRDFDKAAVFGRQGRAGPRGEAEIGVLAVRGGDAVGDHMVFFLGQGERLELVHRAQSRECLVRGALRAARWLAAQREPGRYSMADVLGLPS